MNIAEIITTLWNKRRIILAVAGATTLLAIIIALIMPDYFRSTAILLPETDKSRVSSLAGLSDLASLAGLNLGEESLVKLYPVIIKSESVLKGVIYARYRTRSFADSASLIQIWKIKEKTPEAVYEEALKSLREKLDVSMDNKTNVVTIAIETKEPQLSADIVNKVTSELDEFMRTKRTSNASEQRKWTESRLVQVNEDLQRSENALKDFRERNRRIGDSPQLLLEQERLGREMQINTTLYTELKKQYELIKIEEIKNIPIINIMDPGRPGAFKERPQRREIVLFSFAASLLASMAFVLLDSRFSKELMTWARGLPIKWDWRLWK